MGTGRFEGFGPEAIQFMADLPERLADDFEAAVPVLRFIATIA